MRVVLERFQNDLKLLQVPNKTLKSEGFFKTNKVYIETRGSAEDEKVPFQLSKFYHLLDRHQNTIRIHVNLPLLGKFIHEMSRRMGKPTICIAENKCADQLRSAFVFTRRIVQFLFFLIPKFLASNHLL